MINKGIFNFEARQNDLRITWFYYDEYYINTGKEIADILIKRDNKFGTSSKKSINELIDYPDKQYIHYVNLSNPDPDFTPYKPMEYKDLFLQFAYININDDNEIMNFIKKYGLPVSGLYYPLIDFKKEVKKANELISIYELLLKDNIRELRDIIKTKDDRGNMLWRQNRKRFEKQLNKPEVIFMFLSYIQSNITNILDNEITPIFNKLKYDPDDYNQHFRVFPGWSCKSLLAYMYLQLHFFITENKRIGICKFCGKPFEMGQSTRSDKEYHEKCRKKAWYHKNKNK
ncbi:MAG: hypothetical protein ACOCRK_11335 [bacterium]